MSFNDFKINGGILKTISGSSEDDLMYINDNLTMNTDISEYKLEKILKYLEDNNLNVSLLSEISVDEEFRGKGVGKKLMDSYMTKIYSSTDVDILIARTLNKQSKGFDLESFYEKHGFEGLILEDGDLFMVTKGYRDKLDDLLDLDKERQLIIDWFDKNEVKNDKDKKMLEFTKKRIEEKKHKKTLEKKMDKIIRQFEEHEIYNVVSRIHNEGDLSEGDLEERLEENTYYNHIVDYKLSDIDLNAYDLDEDKIEDIIYEIEEKGLATMPKIIIDKNGEVIDGLHRANALNRLGYKKIDLLKGSDEKFEMKFKKELLIESMGIYKISNDFGSISIMEDAKYSPADSSVFEFVVDEEYRGLGVGTELLKEAMSQYPNLGAQVSSVASLKVFLECGYEPMDLKTKGTFDIKPTSYDFKVFNKDPELLNGQAAMYRNSIELFSKKMNESIELFKDNGGSLYMDDKREMPKLKKKKKLKI